MADAADDYQYLYQVGDVVKVREDLKSGAYPMSNEPGMGIITMSNIYNSTLFSLFGWNIRLCCFVDGM